MIEFEEELENEPARREPRKIDIREMSVLIVDDMINMAKSIHNMMKVIGFGRRFQSANNGRDALRMLQEDPYDLVFLDYNMPEMTGSETLAEIREDRNLRDLPVIMITANAYSDYVAEVGESHVDSYLLKPITVKILEERVTAVIDRANNPPLMIRHLKKARECEDEGDLDGAVQEARLAMEADPNVTRPIRELGYYYLQKGDYDEAEKWLQKAAKLNHLDVFAFHQLGELYLARKDIEKASRYFEKAMQISPRHIDRSINFGKTLLQMERKAKAVQIFDKTLELNGSNEYREDIALTCFEKEIYDYAVKQFEIILGDEPERVDLLFKMSEALEKTDQAQKAITYLTRASEIDKENVDVRIHLARDYLSLGKPFMAEKRLKEILKTNPNNSLAEELLKECA